MFSHAPHSSLRLNDAAAFSENEGDAAESWSTGDADFPSGASKHVVDFVTRLSISDQSLDEHFVKISGSTYVDYKSSVDAAGRVVTEASRAEGDVEGGRRRDGGTRVDDGDADGDEREQSWEYEQSDTEQASCEVSSTVAAPFTSQSPISDPTGSKEAPNAAEVAPSTAAESSAAAKPKDAPSTLETFDEDRPIPTFDPRRRRSRGEAAAAATASRQKRWRSEEDKNRPYGEFRSRDRFANDFVRNAILRQKRIEVMREARLKAIREKVESRYHGGGGGGTGRDEDEEEEEEEGQGKEGETRNGCPRRILRRWKKIRSKSMPDDLPRDFFKFRSREETPSFDDSVEIDEAVFDGYCRARWNHNGNRLRNKSKEKSGGRAKKKNEEEEEEREKSRRRRDRGTKAKDAGDDKKRRSNLRSFEAQRRGSNLQPASPLSEDATSTSPTFRERRIGFVSDESPRDRSRRPPPPLPQPPPPSPPPPPPPRVKVKRRYDARDPNRATDEWEPLKSRRVPWNARPFDYELKPTRLTNGRHREFAPSPPLPPRRPRSPPRFRDERDAAYCVRTPPPGGFDETNPEWRWKFSRVDRRSFLPEERESTKWPSSQRPRDIYLVREDLVNDRRGCNVNRGNGARAAAAYSRDIREGNGYWTANESANEGHRRGAGRVGRNAARTADGTAGMTTRQPELFFDEKTKKPMGFTCGCPPPPNPLPPAPLIPSVAAASTPKSSGENSAATSNDDDDNNRVTSGESDASATASASTASFDSRKSQKSNKSKREKKKVKIKKKKEKEKVKRPPKNDDDGSDYDSKQIKKFESKETIVSSIAASSMPKSLGENSAAASDNADVDNNGQKVKIKKKKEKEKRKKDEDDDDGGDYDFKQIKKFKSNETIVTKRNNGRAPSRRELETPAASLWRSASNLASLIQLLRRSRVSVEDSTSATYLRLRPKTPPQERRRVNREDFCYGVCAQRSSRDGGDIDGGDVDGAGLTPARRRDIDPTDYEHLPSITPDSTPPWYRNSMPRRRPVRRDHPPPPPPRGLPGTSKGYWELEAEQMPRGRRQ